MTASATETRSPMASTVRREPRRWTAGPASGRARSEPTAIAKSTSPSSAGERPRRSRTCGMREGQLAKAKPHIVKATYVPRTRDRTCSGEGAATAETEEDDMRKRGSKVQRGWRPAHARDET